jgi:hypothetical protein
VKKTQVLWLVVAIAAVGMITVAGREYLQLQRSQRALAQQQLWQEQQTAVLLREQMEREHCEKYVKSIADLTGVSDMRGAPELVGLSVCADPKSDLRMRLRQSAAVPGPGLRRKF